MGKDFKQKISSKRLNSLIPEKEMEMEVVQSPTKVAQQIIRKEQTVPASTKSTPPTTTVTTFRVNTEKLNQIKAMAYWDRKKIQDVFDEALELYLEKIGKTDIEIAVEAFQKSQNK